MDFKIVTGLVSSVINAIEQSAIASVRQLKSNTFSSRVVNFPKTQQIKGTVTVGNQGKLEKEVKHVKSEIKDLTKTIKAIKYPERVAITNFPEPERSPEFPKSFEISNFPTQKEFPREIAVNNQPIKELVDLLKALQNVQTEIKNKDLSPNINLPKMDPVVVPAPNVSVTQEKIDYEELAKILSENSDKIDYKKLAETIASEIGQMVVTGGGGGGKYAYKDSSGNVSYGLVKESHVQTDIRKFPRYSIKIEEENGGLIKYLAMALPGTPATAEAWQVRKIDKTNTLEVFYAEGTDEFIHPATNITALNYF